MSYDLAVSIEIAWADLYRSALARAVAAVAARNGGDALRLELEAADQVEWREAA